MDRRYEILKQVHAELSANNPKDWKRFEEIMTDGTGDAMFEAMEIYAIDFMKWHLTQSAYKADIDEVANTLYQKFKSNNNG